MLGVYLLLLFTTLFVLGLVVWQISNIVSMVLGAPAISSPHHDFWQMLIERDSALSEKSIIDLGCGAGSACIAMSPHFFRVYGMEASPFYYVLAKWRTRKYKNVTIIFGNILTAEWPKTEYVYCYLLSPVMEKLLPRFTKEKRIVLSLTFKVPGKEPKKTYWQDDKKLHLYLF